MLTGAPPFLVLLTLIPRSFADTYGTKLYPETWFIDPAALSGRASMAGRDWVQRAHRPIWPRAWPGPTRSKRAFSGGNPRRPRRAFAPTSTTNDDEANTSSVAAKTSLSGAHARV